MSEASSPNQPGYFQRYMDLVQEQNLPEAFTAQQAVLEVFLQSISETRSQYRYAPDKWSVKEVLQHLSDCERIFSYRALCIARGEKQALPGFNENEYAAESNANRNSWAFLVEEFMAVRKASWWLFKGFDAGMLAKEGTANGQILKVESLGFILLGHYYHHEKVLKMNYRIA